MFRKLVLTGLVMLMAALIVPGPVVAGDTASKPPVDLSAEVMALLRAEMAQLSAGIQSIALFIAAADWQAIAETGEKMHASYLMKKSLTQSQAMELKQKLPAEFKQLDAVFHARAKKLASAAVTEDSELVVFHYARLVETCVACHSAFASSRFPGFVKTPQAQHKH
ncbi:MAG: cytochrome c [Gammaproteobacteria bacterium]|nr:cytochrome c [Gammaproteobacteria bacterium]